MSVLRDPGDSRRASLKRVGVRRVDLAGCVIRRFAPGLIEATHRTAGGWKSSRMVAHYAAAVAAEQGAVATYL